MKLSDSGGFSNIKYFPVDSKPYGLSYSDWVAKYYAWVASIPENNYHPIADKTGSMCSTLQTNSHVYFLPGAPSGYTISRKCTIPSDKAVLVSLLFSLCDEKMDDITTFASAVECVEDGLRETQITLIVDDMQFDGKSLPDINNFKVKPQVLKVAYAENNYLLSRGNYTPGQEYRSVIGAYAIILEPLLRGEHFISYNVISRGCTQHKLFHINLKYYLETI